MRRVVKQLLFSVIILVMIREWLVPVIELTNTAFLGWFVGFVALCLLLNVVKLPFYINGLLKIMYMLLFLTEAYTPFHLWDAEGISFLIQDATLNMQALFSGRFYEFTNALRTVLFIILLWMLCYLIDHFMMVRHSILVFFTLTICFIATIDTFTAYDGTRGIVITLVLGLLLMLVLYVDKITHTYEVKLNYKQLMRIGGTLVLTVGAVTAFALLMPKAAPQWPDPVPFFKSLAGQGGKTTASAGIGEDDTSLGGSFAGDSTVVYEVTANEPQYWRVETKSTYTSKGWADEEPVLTDMLETDIAYSLPVGSVENQQVAQVVAKAEHSFIIQPYGTYAMQIPLEEARLVFNISTERLTTYLNQEKVSLPSYNIGFSEPEYLYSALKEPGGAEYLAVESKYYELPELPQRIYDLANELAGENASTYDIAKAIERYFKTSGFIYRTTDVPKPTEEQDYVDQFLFETKAGYCDNFSTAMVVLLRANGIAARWVKGYAEGTEVRRLEDGRKVYEITNNDAHSWVEAYIPGVGWMPFEPTIGFDQNVAIDFDIDLSQNTEIAEQATQEQQQLQIEKEEAAQKKKDVVKKENKKAENGGWWKYVLGGLLLVAIIAFFTRRKWQPMLPMATPTTSAGAYRNLERKLAKRGIVRRRGETLRQFARRVDIALETDQMRQFVENYEQQLYGKKNEVPFLEIKEYYEYLINRLDG